MEPRHLFVKSFQTAFWALFVVVEMYLLIPYAILGALQGMRSQNSKNPKKKTVVIVGGNFAGLAALRKLQKKSELFNIVIIDQNDYFEYTPGILRLFCEPNAVSDLTKPLPRQQDHSNNLRILKGTVTHTGDQKVTYQSAHMGKSETVAFDYLILATGSTFNYPVSASPTETTIEARAEGWKTAAQQVKEASSILILGGGAVGTELAAEIADYDDSQGGNNSKRKSVTIVDAATRLVPIFPQNVSDYAEKWLQTKGVNVLLGQMLESWNTTSCTLRNGKKIEADLVFVCFGDKPNSGPLASIDPDVATTLQPVQLDRRKCVEVDASLRVIGRTNAFCCGDVANPPTEGAKQAFHAEVQGHLAAANVIRSAQGKALLRYPEDAALGSHLMPMVYVLSLGQYDGVIGFNSLAIPGPLAPVLKWIIEWTKVRQMLGKPIGDLVWKIGDSVAFFLSKNLLPPVSNAVQKRD